MNFWKYLLKNHIVWAVLGTIGAFSFAIYGVIHDGDYGSLKITAMGAPVIWAVLIGGYYYKYRQLIKSYTNYKNNGK